MRTTSKDLIRWFEQGTKRYHLVGDANAGVLVGLDLEGRLYALLDGRVLNRVNQTAILGISRRDAYLNPGGDGLWPAPEGSMLGYEYATGGWRVPPGLSGARYWVTAADTRAATVRAEVDLINARGVGVPVALERRIEVAPAGRTLGVTVTEAIEYLGARVLPAAEALIAPWTLAQFDSGPGCETVFPDAGSACVWDLYDPSDDRRALRDGLWHARTDGSGKRYQLGIAPEVAWLEYHDPRDGLRVRRTAAPLPAGQRYVDITDRPPDQPPTERGIRYSVYSDPSCFMEIEAAGGAWPALEPGAASRLVVRTEYAM